MSGSKVFLVAGREDVGTELWVIADNAPNAADDQASTAPGTLVHIDVLDNDGDPVGTLDPSSVVIARPPPYGTIVVDAKSGAVAYTPASGFSGTDSFQYTVRDDSGLTSNVATVSVVVAASVGGGPGSAPPPTPTPTPAPTSSSGGGGGALGGELLGLALLLALKRTRRL